MVDYEIYTDGGYSMQADLGAFAYVILQNGEIIRKYAQKIEHETNNRAEIKAIMESVLSLPSDCKVVVYSDSQYALGVLSGGYKAKKNTDLVNFYKKSVKTLGIKVQYQWIKGHSGNKYNELCDAMCNEAAGMDLNAIPKKKMQSYHSITDADIKAMNDKDLFLLLGKIQTELLKRKHK